MTPPVVLAFFSFLGAVSLACAMTAARSARDFALRGRTWNPHWPFTWNLVEAWAWGAIALVFVFSTVVFVWTAVRWGMA
jgi:hypothetical protein